MSDSEWARQQVQVLIWRALLALAAQFDALALELRR